MITFLSGKERKNYTVVAFVPNKAQQECLRIYSQLEKSSPVSQLWVSRMYAQMFSKKFFPCPEYLHSRANISEDCHKGAGRWGCKAWHTWQASLASWGIGKLCAPFQPIPEICSMYATILLTSFKMPQLPFSLLYYHSLVPHANRLYCWGAHSKLQFNLWINHLTIHI